MIDPQTPGTSPTAQRASQRWYYSVWAVVLLLLNLGPFGLPFLWKSARFNLAAKLVGTVLTLLYTWWLIAITAGVAQRLFKQFDQLLLLQP